MQVAAVLVQVLDLVQVDVLVVLVEVVVVLVEVLVEKLLVPLVEQLRVPLVEQTLPLWIWPWLGITYRG